MTIHKCCSNRAIALSLTVLLAVLLSACSKSTAKGVKKMQANQEYSGFLKDYSKLAPNPNLEGAVKTFVNADAQKNLHRYVAIIVDPVEVYLASGADDAKISDQTRMAVANYFRASLTHAVSDAFAPVDQPGPLVLRLRAAVIGVDAGGPLRLKTNRRTPTGRSPMPRTSAKSASRLS